MHCSAFALVIPPLCCTFDDLYGHDLLVCQLGMSHPHVQHMFQLLKYFSLLEYAGLWAPVACPGGGGIVPLGAGPRGVGYPGNEGECAYGLRGARPLSLPRPRPLGCPPRPPRPYWTLGW